MHKTFFKVKRSRLKPKSGRQKLIEKIDALYLQLLKKQRGDKSEITGRQPVGLFHVLPKGKYPRMRWHSQNVYLVEWLPSHFYWHHDRSDPRAKRVEGFLIFKLGLDYEDYLKALDKMQPKLTDNQLWLYYIAFKQELEAGLVNDLQP